MLRLVLFFLPTKLFAVFCDADRRVKSLHIEQREFSLFFVHHTLLILLHFLQLVRAAFRGLLGLDRLAGSIQTSFGILFISDRNSFSTEPEPGSPRRSEVVVVKEKRSPPPPPIRPPARARPPRPSRANEDYRRAGRCAGKAQGSRSRSAI